MFMFPLPFWPLPCSHFKTSPPLVITPPNSKHKHVIYIHILIYKTLCTYHALISSTTTTLQAFMAFVPAPPDQTSIDFRTHQDFHLPFSSTHQDFNDAGMSSMLMRRSMSFSGCDHNQDNLRVDDEMSDDDGSSQLLGEKKIRRLNLQQVKALERSFEVGNKLEPERKMELARALGLQPRQIAIWFQNRRARWKTKQLEKDYQFLKRQFDALMSDNDALKSQNKKLHSQLQLLTVRDQESAGGAPKFNLNKENEGCWSDDNSIDVDHVGTTTRTSSADSQQLYSNNNKHVMFPSANSPNVAASMTQLLQGSSRPDVQCDKIAQSVPDEGFCNVFTAVDDHTNFWPWTEQQQFQ